MQAIRLQARSATLSQQETKDKIGTIKADLQQLRTLHQEKKAAIQAQDAHLRALRQTLLTQKKAQKQSPN